ncbi:MAG: hypothetical protein LLG04_16960 [Parachlamydia sp.]|nr:hypothetical protein [Parachlamydia sp.]
MSNPTNRVGALPANKTELNAHTEQALLQLVYVRTSNDMIGDAMTNLDLALQTTQSVLNILQALQNLHNNISVQSKSAFPFIFSTGQLLLPSGTPLVSGVLQVRSSAAGTIHIISTVIPNLFDGGSRDASNYQAAYNKAASAYFGKAIDPFFIFTSPTSPGFTQFVATLQTLKDKLRLEISALTKQTPSAQLNDPTTLLANIRKVYNELPTNFGFSAVEKWALDNYNLHGSTATGLGGNLQNDLTFAITAAETLNDTQKEKVRRFLFIFQQYYQSAAAVLSAIHQIVNQMAQKISQ